MPIDGPSRLDAATARDEVHDDPDQGAPAYERSAGVRIEVARQRLEAGIARGETAAGRDRAARRRDAAAARRDREASARDSEARLLDMDLRGVEAEDLGVEELRSWLTSIRRRAAADREEAARDREEAARDCEQAARDRNQAARDRRVAGTDELTGARRRGIGLEELEREIDRARRTGASLVAVFVDVDHLKSINDRFGHSAGDELLRAVVNRLRRQLRSYDVIIRLGGDEFLCALPGVTVEQARARFAELNSELQTAHPDGSVSVGFSELHDHETRPQLIDRADHDLLATRTGRRDAATPR